MLVDTTLPKFWVYECRFFRLMLLNRRSYGFHAGAGYFVDRAGMFGLPVWNLSFGFGVLLIPRKGALLN